MALVKFMQGTAGRAVRIVAGGALIAVGIALNSTVGIIVAVVGVVPLAAGAAGICLFAPLFGLTLKGSATAHS